MEEHALGDRRDRKMGMCIPMALWRMWKISRCSEDGIGEFDPGLPTFPVQQFENPGRFRLGGIASVCSQPPRQDSNEGVRA